IGRESDHRAGSPSRGASHRRRPVEGSLRSQGGGGEGARPHAAGRAEERQAMNISAAFIRRPIGTSLLAAALLLVGIAAWPFLPVAPLPQVDFPTIQVNTSFPGASPETMAATVATPLERQFSLIPGLL